MTTWLEDRHIKMSGSCLVGIIGLFKPPGRTTPSTRPQLTIPIQPHPNPLKPQPNPHTKHSRILTPLPIRTYITSTSTLSLSLSHSHKHTHTSRDTEQFLRSQKTTRGITKPLSQPHRQPLQAPSLSSSKYPNGVVPKRRSTIKLLKPEIPREAKKPHHILPRSALHPFNICT